MRTVVGCDVNLTRTDRQRLGLICPRHVSSSPHCGQSIRGDRTSYKWCTTIQDRRQIQSTVYRGRLQRGLTLATSRTSRYAWLRSATMTETTTGLPHVSNQEDTINGYYIPKGTMVSQNFGYVVLVCMERLLTLSDLCSAIHAYGKIRRIFVLRGSFRTVTKMRHHFRIRPRFCLDLE